MSNSNITMKKYRYIKVTYSAKTNPEVMAFQVLVRNYTLKLKKSNIKLKYIKDIQIPFKVKLYDRFDKLQYQTTDYRRLKYMINRVECMTHDLTSEEKKIVKENNKNKCVPKK